MNIAHVRVLASLCVLAVMTVACDRSDGAIRFSLVADAAELAGYQELVNEFHATDPGFEVALNPVASRGDLMAQLTTAFAGGSPPDVFLLNFRSYGQFAADGALEPVQPMLDDSEVLAESDLEPVSLDAFRYEGDELTCLPQNVSSLVVYYNVDLFEAHGLDAPRAGWTWDDFLATARELTDGETYGLGVEASLIRLAPFVWSNGGELVDDEDSPTRLELDDPATRDAIEWFLDLSLRHEVVPPDAEEQAESAEERFLRGGLGMLLESRQAVPTLRTIEGFEWDVAQLPVAPGGEPAGILHSDAYCIAADSEHQDEAWAFAEFAMSQEGQSILSESGRLVPVREDVQTSESFLQPDAPPANSQVFLDNIEHLRAVPHVAQWAEVEEVSESILTDAFYGRVARADALEQLDREVARILRGGSDGG